MNNAVFKYIQYRRIPSRVSEISAPSLKAYYIVNRITKLKITSFF